MKIFRKAAALVFAALMVLSLTACSAVVDEVVDKLTESQMKALVQGNLDELYLGKFDEEYLKSVNSSATEAEEVHRELLEVKAEDFAYYFGIEFLTDDLRAEIVELCDQIYSKANYTVGEGTVVDDTTVSVEVTVYPIDIYQQMIDAAEEYMADFYAKYTEDVVNAMDDAAYVAYDAEWAGLVIDLCREKLPNLGYGEARTLGLQVTLENDVWCLSDAALTGFDALVITYP